MSPFGQAATVVRAVEVILALGVVLSSTEWLANARHLRDDALLSWPVSQLRHPWLTSGVAPRLLNRLFAYPGIIWLVAIRLAAALLLASGLTAGPTRAAVTVVAALITVAIPLRSPFGLDGSDQMATFVLGTLALYRLSPSPLVQAAFLWVVALQSCLAYVTAGYAKLISPIWRSGAAISGISATRMYGSPAALRLFSGRPSLCMALAWSVILTECLFVAALFTPPPITVAILCAGALFHLTSGLVMGLNTFIWSFLATYPAILWAQHQIHAAF